MPWAKAALENLVVVFVEEGAMKSTSGRLAPFHDAHSSFDTQYRPPTGCSHQASRTRPQLLLYRVRCASRRACHTPRSAA
jgi:hypothetical protein